MEDCQNALGVGINSLFVFSPSAHTHTELKLVAIHDNNKSTREIVLVFHRVDARACFVVCTHVFFSFGARTPHGDSQPLCLLWLRCSHTYVFAKPYGQIDVCMVKVITNIEQNFHGDCRHQVYYCISGGAASTIFWRMLLSKLLLIVRLASPILVSRQQCESELSIRRFVGTHQLKLIL